MDTIKLLETIGQDASLRHASASDLEKMLDDMQASNELKRAASLSDAAPLKQELGYKSMGVNQGVNQGGCEEDEDEDGKVPDLDDDDE